MWVIAYMRLWSYTFVCSTCTTQGLDGAPLPPLLGLLLLAIAGASDGVLYSCSGHLLHMSGGGIG